MLQKEIKYAFIQPDELDVVERQLFAKAKAALDFSHSPYSKYKVACAILMEDGTIWTGSNQENASFPAGLCAERVALFSVKSNHRQGIRCILTLAEDEHGSPGNAFSCGICRQVMLEYADHQKEKIEILMQDENGKFLKVENVKELLPFHFTFNNND